MSDSDLRRRFPRVGDGSGIEKEHRLYPEELQLAFRNKALPLEALRYDTTPTGLHYTLCHYDIPLVGPAGWRLSVRGRVQHELSLTLEELQQRPARELTVTMQCAGDGRALLSPRPVGQPWLAGAVGTARWTGTPLRWLLSEAGLLPDARELLFTGLDRGIEGGTEQDYQRSLSATEALAEDVLLAWGMNGAPLEPQHGFPLRLVVPGWYGMAHVKWLSTIEAIPDPFDGYQQAASYRYTPSRNEPGTPVERMRVHSLMVPPGIPDFLTRTRVVRVGPVELTGRAWSGEGEILGVEVSTDGGVSWGNAELDQPAGQHAWRSWRFWWQARAAGHYQLRCRASDSAGNVQPLEQYWTARGMGNNMAQRIEVLASDPAADAG